MKKFVFFMVIINLLIIIITGCNEKKEEHTFKATIIECSDNTMIVTPFEDEEEYKSSDKFSINFVEGFNSNACSVNGKVEIKYEGGINESYPAQIGVTSIKLINE